MVNTNCLFPFKLAFNVASGVFYHNSVDAGVGCGDGDDDGLLHGGVQQGAVDSEAAFVVDGDAHGAEALVEVDVDGVVARARFNGVGANTAIQRTL